MTDPTSPDTEVVIEATQDADGVNTPNRLPNVSILRSFISTFWPFIRPYRWALILAYLGTAVVALTTLAVGFVINDQLDSVVDNVELLQSMVDFAFLIIVILIIRTLIWAISTYTISWAGVNYIRNIRNDVFRRVMHHGNAIIDEESSGELQTRVIADTSQLGTFLGVTIPTVLATVVGLIGGIGGAIYVSPKLTILAVGATAIFTIPILAFSPTLRKFGERLQKAEALSGRHAGEAFRARDVVYAFNQFDRESDQFSYFTGEVKRYFLAQERLQIAIFGVFRVIVFSTLVVGAAYGINLITAGELTLGTLVAFAYFAAMIVGNGMSVVQLITTFNVAMGRAQKLIEILQLPREDDSSPGRDLGGGRDIELRGICYTYPTRNTRALNNINIRIPYRSKVALVGVSGIGKIHIIQNLTENS